MATVKERLDEARDLIKAKEYGKARTILKKIDHPRAKEWLEKIDDIDPFGEVGEPVKNTPPAKQPNRAVGCIKTVFFYLVVVPILIGVALAVYSSMSGPTRPAQFASFKDRVVWVVEDNNVGNVEGIYVDDKSIQLHMKLYDFSGEVALDDAKDKAIAAACALYEDGIRDRQVALFGKISLVDAFGKESEDTGVRIVFEPSTIARVDCDNTINVNVGLIADDYWVHPAISRELE